MTFVENMLVRSGTLEMPQPLLDPKSKYRAFFQLCKPRPKQFEEILNEIRDSYETLIGHREILKFFHSEAQRRFLMHLIAHHQIVICVNETYKKSHHMINHLYNNASYVNIVAEYFNHSCYPNVGLSIKEGIVSGTVIRMIKKNEQLFVSYIDGNYKPIEGFSDDRQAMFMEYYNFQCTCEVCQLDRLPSNLELSNNSIYRANMAVYAPPIINDESFTPNQIELIKNYCFTFLVKFHRSAWCTEIGDIIKILLDVLARNPTGKTFSPVVVFAIPLHQ